MYTRRGGPRQAHRRLCNTGRGAGKHGTEGEHRVQRTTAAASSRGALRSRRRQLLQCQHAGRRCGQLRGGAAAALGRLPLLPVLASVAAEAWGTRRAGAGVRARLGRGHAAAAPPATCLQPDRVTFAAACCSLLPGLCPVGTAQGGTPPAVGTAQGALGPPGPAPDHVAARGVGHEVGDELDLDAGGRQHPGQHRKAQQVHCRWVSGWVGWGALSACGVGARVPWTATSVRCGLELPLSKAAFKQAGTVRNKYADTKQKPKHSAGEEQLPSNASPPSVAPPSFRRERRG